MKLFCEIDAAYEKRKHLLTETWREGNICFVEGHDLNLAADAAAAFKNIDTRGVSPFTTSHVHLPCPIPVTPATHSSRALGNWKTKKPTHASQLVATESNKEISAFF